jgi:hypothetical protein
MWASLRGWNAFPSEAGLQDFEERMKRGSSRLNNRKDLSLSADKY